MESGPSIVLEKTLQVNSSSFFNCHCLLLTMSFQDDRLDIMVGKLIMYSGEPCSRVREFYTNSFRSSNTWRIFLIMRSDSVKLRVWAPSEAASSGFSWVS